MKKIITIFIASATVAQAQNFDWFKNLVFEIKDLVQISIPVLVVLALALFIWGVVQFIFTAGDEKVRGEGKKKIAWGVVGLFVIVSVWGLVAFISEITDIGPTDDDAIKAPQATFKQQVIEPAS
jgi:uncharacterized membrane protein YqhA